MTFGYGIDATDSACKINGAEQTSGSHAKGLAVTVMIGRLQLEDGLATRSAQGAAKRFGCCHHGAILRGSTDL